MKVEVTSHFGDKVDVIRLRTALEQVGHLPYTRPYRLPREGGMAWVQQLFTAPDNCTLLAHAGEAVVGGLTLVRRPWESDIFGLRMARIPYAFVCDQETSAERAAIAQALLRAARPALKQMEVEHCSALVPAEYTALLHAFGEDRWLLTDSTLELAWDYRRATAPQPDARYQLRLARDSDRTALRELARVAYTESTQTRFSADPGLPRAQAGEMYARWIDESLSGAFADAVVVAEANGEPFAFYSVKVDQTLTNATGAGFAAQGLTAVDSRYAGLGTSGAMLQWIMAWQAEHDIQFSYGRTLISNYPMQLIGSRTGAFVGQAYHTFHGWL